MASKIKEMMHGNGSGSDSGAHTPINTYTDKVKRLFLTKNTEQSAELLNDLVAATDLCDSFLLEFEESHVKEIAEKLCSLGVWDIKSFANKTDLFRDAEPLWGTENAAAASAQQAAKYLQNFLLKARSKISESDLDGVTASAARRRSRPASRGRSRERKKHKTDKRKAKRASSSSSNSSSAKRHEASVD